jgi:hypothetical protein
MLVSSTAGSDWLYGQSDVNRNRSGSNYREIFRVAQGGNEMVLALRIQIPTNRSSFVLDNVSDCVE